MTNRFVWIAGLISGIIKRIDKFGFIVSTVFMSAAIYGMVYSYQMPAGTAAYMVFLASCGSMLYSLMHMAVWKD